jgi:hypothetical protein
VLLEKWVAMENHLSEHEPAPFTFLAKCDFRQDRSRSSFLYRPGTPPEAKNPRDTQGA